MARKLAVGKVQPKSDARPSKSKVSDDRATNEVLQDARRRRSATSDSTRGHDTSAPKKASSTAMRTPSKAQRSSGESEEDDRNDGCGYRNPSSSISPVQ